jgi:hypothetical protein
MVSPQQDGAADQFDRRLMSTALVCHQSQKVQRVGVPGVNLEHLAVQLFGFAQPTSLVMGDGNSQGIDAGGHEVPRTAG